MMFIRNLIMPLTLVVSVFALTACGKEKPEYPEIGSDNLEKMQAGMQKYYEQAKVWEVNNCAIGDWDITTDSLAEPAENGSNCKMFGAYTYTSKDDMTGDTMHHFFGCNYKQENVCFVHTYIDIKDENLVTKPSKILSEPL